jgi:hypothetical protein
MSENREGSIHENTVDFKILTAKSWEELLSALDAMDAEGSKLAGSQREFTGAELKEIVEKVRDGKELFLAVPKTRGLRDKVTELLGGPQSKQK